VSDDLPEGWAEAPTSAISTDVCSGFASGEKDVVDGVPHLRMNNIGSDGRLTYELIRRVPHALMKADLYLRQADVLVCTTNSGKLVGKTATFDREEGGFAFSNHITRLRPISSVVDGYYLGWHLWLHWAQGGFADACKHWVNQSALPKDALLDTNVRLPPLPEQRRIVAKVESLLDEVNRAKVRLNRVPVILKRFRQAVLAVACSGELTREWREQNPSASTRAIRNDIDPSNLPEVPLSWQWVRLTDLGELGRGKSRHRPRNDPSLYGGPYPFIQTGDVARSGGRISRYSQTYNDLGLAQSRLWPVGTVCITIAANIAESGILTFSACFPDSVVGLVTDPSICLPAYAEFFIRTARSSLSQFAPATAQANINLEILSNEVAVPLPPMPEQAEIVRQVDALFALADAIERRVAVATARAEKLPQAILAKAFAGELVPTEAELARAEGRDYETAAALLARVARDAATGAPTATPKRRGRPPKSAR
jgi:type I restriction enzyme S subunit